MRDAVCAVVAVINNSKGENSYMLATSLSNIFFWGNKLIWTRLATSVCVYHTLDYQIKCKYVHENDT
jgi:hypothetical protein